MKDENNLTLVEHLGELRKRIIIIIIVFLICSGSSFFYIQPIMEKLISVGKSYFDFIYISPPELFLSYIKVAILFGLIIALPIIFLQIWLFIQPGFENIQSRVLLMTLVAGMIFFLIGVIFSYKIALPVSLQFFGEMTIEDIQPMISIENYIGFVSSILLAFGLVFEMPMVVGLLSRLGIISSRFLIKNRKYIVLIIFIIAAIITPPDVFSQVLIAIPMLLLYEISIILSRVIERSRKKKLEEG